MKWLQKLKRRFCVATPAEIELYINVAIAAMAFIFAVLLVGASL